MNSLPDGDAEKSGENSVDVASNMSLNMNGNTNGRKRKANSSTIETHIEEIFDRYILNNWEQPENG